MKGRGPRVMATSPADTCTGPPPSGTIHALPPMTATTLSGASSTTRTHHGGAMTMRMRKASRARGPSSRPARASIGGIVDDRAWNRAIRPWIISIGSGGAYAQAAARALVQHTELGAQDIVKQSLVIAGDLCIYTNQNHTIETLG